MALNVVVGRKGYIEVRGLGAKMAIFRSWKLTRRKKESRKVGEEEGLYDLYAECEFIKADLWGDPSYEKEIWIFLASGKARLEQQPGYDTIFPGGVAFRMEGVRKVS